MEAMHWEFQKTRDLYYVGFCLSETLSRILINLNSTQRRNPIQRPR
jgi:hypothetical protein